MRKAVISFIIFVFLFILIFLLKGENIFYTSLSPLQRLLYGQAEDVFIANNFYLELEETKLKIYQAENELLKRHLNFLETTKDNFLLANIIGKGYEVGFDWFIIDRGSRDGVKKSLAIVDEKGVLIGTVVKVKDFIAYLRPIFDRHSSVAADILWESSQSDIQIVSGLVQGEYGSTIKMKYIPLNKAVNLGDTIITSGLDKNIRRGIIIGRVAAIDKKPNAIFQEVVIKPLFNPNFRIVSILLP